MLLFCEIGLKINEQHNSINMMSRLITSSVLDTYLKIPKKINHRDKFDCYDTIVNNMILQNTVKNDFVNVFYLSQKSYWILYRFVYNIRMSKVKNAQ
jgi:hypothetical protein